MEYQCIFCNYKTNTKGNYVKHTKTIKHKKNEICCDKKYTCDICNKDLSSKQCLENHILSCRGVKSSLQCSKCQKNFNNSNTRYIHEKKCNQNNIKIMTENNISHIKIAVNSICKENIDYFSESPDFIDFMKDCMKNKVNGICNLIAKKHFDPEHPENHNIRKFNKKDCFLEIYTNNNWNTKHYKDGFDLITISLENTFALFMEKMLENKEINDKVIRHFMKEVGSILGWDLSVGKYNYSFNNCKMNNDMSATHQKMLKFKIYRTFCEAIFNYTRIIHTKIKK